MLGIAAAICSMAMAVAVLGAAMSAHSTAQTAADLGALAGAQVLIDGLGPAEACAAATRIATANGARLTSCQPGADDTVATITETDLRAPPGAWIAPLTATARALAGRPPP
jgi:secretion/DNA translocation related TadE-like protein